MHSLIFCLVFMVFLQNVKPKVYVIDLTEPGSDENDNINLGQLLNQFYKPPETNKFRELILSKDDISKMIRNKTDPEDCLMSLETTKAEKLKCLANIKKNTRSRGPISVYIPRFFREYYAERPKRTILSLYNYYGGPHKTKPSFRDLTRQEFSQDYLDISDLSRSEQYCDSPQCQNHNERKKYLTLPKKIVRRSNDDKTRVFLEDEIQRTRSSDESSSDSSDDKKKARKKHRSPNRFQVVFNEEASRESDEENVKKQSSNEENVKKQSSNEEKSSESVEKRKKHKKKRPKPKKPRKVESDSDFSVEMPKPKKSKEKYAYLQGNRVFEDLRRRLQHFLPKRYHWEEHDIHNLGYYWYDGPRGKYFTK